MRQATPDGLPAPENFGHVSRRPIRPRQPSQTPRNIIPIWLSRSLGTIAKKSSLKKALRAIASLQCQGIQPWRHNQTVFRKR